MLNGQQWAFCIVQSRNTLKALISMNRRVIDYTRAWFQRMNRLHQRKITERIIQLEKKSQTFNIVFGELYLVCMAPKIRICRMKSTGKHRCARTRTCWHWNVMLSDINFISYKDVFCRIISRESSYIALTFLMAIRKLFERSGILEEG